MDKSNTAISTPVGVLDKAMFLLGVLERGPQSLAELSSASGLPRPTTHRLAAALEQHRMLARDQDGRYVLGDRLTELAAATAGDTLPAMARSSLVSLRDSTGESVQLFRRVGIERVCVAVADRESGLRDTVPLGARLPLTAGSAAQVLVAWDNPDPELMAGAVFDRDDLAQVRRREWAASVAQRLGGVASVSAPIMTPSGTVAAALSLSGPIARLSEDPGNVHADAVLAHAREVSRHVFGQADSTSATGS